ncbi:MAG: PfkB family carbohydrate kinase [Planctomycetota bacterium]
MNRYLELVRRFPSARIAVVGDAVADEYLHGTCTRISREAPVLILRYEKTETLCGQAANTAMNLLTLGARTRIVSVIGPDGSGRALRRLLRDAGGDMQHLMVVKTLETARKVRIVGGAPHTSHQQLLRIDRVPSCNTREVRAILAREAVRAVAWADAVVVCDYGGGVVSPAFRRFLLARCRRLKKIVCVDSRYDLTAFRGIGIATPNESEAREAAGATDSESLESAGRRLLKRLGSRALLVTQGKLGMTLFERGEPAPRHIPVVGPTEAVDATGAGDTVAAVVTLALAAGGSFEEAARLANNAAGIVVMRRGTAQVTPAELAASVHQYLA